MSEILSEYHLLGLTIGVCTFIIIGVFHPITIKCEYYFGTRCWWWFLLLGIIGIGGSFWTIGEIFEQEKRVQRGWFPANPAKKNKKICNPAED